MLSRSLRRGSALLQKSSIPRRLPHAQIRTVTAAPRPGDGPLMERRADRELPDVEATQFRWRRTLPLFLAVCVAGSLAIFNYQKSSSPVVAATLYALRVNPAARELLGDEIYFAQRIPWIRGEMNQLKGRIDISFSVKGTKGEATMRFASRRPTSRGVFETTEWSIVTADGETIDLLDGGDPFKAMPALGGGDEDEDEVSPRGFRGR